MPLSRVLVANRGEIAVRIVRACKSLGLETVVAVSAADRDSMAARMADRAVCIGPARSSDSYLRQDLLLATALGTGCDAVHPGYGFLSENAGFAAACAENGVIFVGPSAENIRQMGNKLIARDIAREVGVPLAPGSPRITDFAQARGIAEEIGMPVLFKAAAGGGGRGIRIVRSAADLKPAFETASAEAQAAFGDNALFLERYIDNARHVEVQILADGHGTVIHLGERDCSLQRRYQKVLEEAPAFGLDAALRNEIRAAAVALARHIGYCSAGTVEFIVDADRGRFFFLEMNTRVQVEHPVTEAIAGIDIVAEQLRVAAGEPLSVTQEQVHLTGHAIECRINAESPLRGFAPSPGRLTEWAPPEGDGLRIDSHAHEGYVIPPFYDSLVGKLIVLGTDRSDAIERARRALGDFRVAGIETTIPFLEHVLAQEDFRAGRINTKWLEGVSEDYIADHTQGEKRA
ncbi:acetyl-CoA carboxylase biotin carboxylase subunit [Salipiger abyssi]|uniref:acetyl-CoA carboxylase biotin carboxylase subunit n=1 Tax=Salipiger abyssi TaxID=1250539 RepID=UPI001A8C01AF|nr:acetyl-CoA carboxylase biotin carboxylase subunit [Salipiger abyssi]MBN9887176.1 acetyl-CoA carboxylase biotin carboxylase subunit [Salipiger abyssi]